MVAYNIYRLYADMEVYRLRIIAWSCLLDSPLGSALVGGNSRLRLATGLAHMSMI